MKRLADISNFESLMNAAAVMGTFYDSDGTGNSVYFEITPQGNVRVMGSDYGGLDNPTWSPWKTLVEPGRELESILEDTLTRTDESPLSAEEIKARLQNVDSRQILKAAKEWNNDCNWQIVNHPNDKIKVYDPPENKNEEGEPTFRSIIKGIFKSFYADDKGKHIQG